MDLLCSHGAAGVKPPPGIVEAQPQNPTCALQCLVPLMTRLMQENLEFPSWRRREGGWAEALEQECLAGGPW